jgi:2-methylcitrate dehydratase PrpD
VTLIDRLAEFMNQVSYETLPRKTVEKTKLHVFDTLAATRVGARTEEGKANLELFKKWIPSTDGPGTPVPGFDVSAPLPSAVFLSCVATRLTEMDDIDIASCTTPGSVAVPAAFALAHHTGASGRSFLESVVVGYEVMTRLAAAVNGPEILYRGIWPTYLCAAICVAAVGSRMLRLSADQTRHALAISLSMSTGTAGKIKGGLTSRWLTLGSAAQSGLLAALAAERGFSGDVSVLDALFPSVHGLDLRPEVLLAGLAETFMIDRVNVKPYCCARQGIASVEAFRWILRNHAIRAEDLEEVEVLVPQQYSQMIDRGDFPEDRLASITGIQYQLALAAFHEEDLFDTERKVLRDNDTVRAFMKKVRVAPSSPLTEMFPQKWPGKISVKSAGKSLEHEVLSPRGDTADPMTWADVEQKWKRAGRHTVEPKRIEELQRKVKEIDEAKKVDGLLRTLSQPKTL